MKTLRGWKIRSVCCSDMQIVEISDGPIIKFSYDLCGKVISKANIKYKTPSRVTHSRDNTYKLSMQ